MVTGSGRWQIVGGVPTYQRRGGTALITSSISYNEARTGCGWRGRRGQRDQIILEFLSFDINIFQCLEKALTCH